MLPQHIITEDLKEDEISIPSDLSDYYSTLIAGSNKKIKNSSKCISFCKDVAKTTH